MIERPSRRGDALLELAHLVGQRRLVAHRARHAPEQGRDLRAGLDEAEDVVDEQQHVLVLHVAEVLGHGQRRQGDAQAHPRRLVHLAVDQGRLLDDARLAHLEQQVGALAGALAHAGEDRHALVLLGDAADHLHDEDGLAHAGTAEEADLAALHVGREQVDDLDAGLEHRGARLELVERRRVAVDLPVVLDRSDVVGVEGLADHVEDVAEHRVADRHGDAPAGLAHHGAAHQSVGGLHAHAAHAALADLLGDLGDDGHGQAVEHDVHLDRVVDLGQRVRRELDVHHRSGDRDDASGLEGGLVRGHGHWLSHFPERSASAPPTISMISVVIESWRARFMIRRQGLAELVGVVGRGGHRALLAGVEADARPSSRAREDLALEGPRARAR